MVNNILAYIIVFSLLITMAESNRIKDVSYYSDDNKIITAFGDSLTAGYNLPSEQSYPSILDKKLKENGYNYNVVNSGLSGETTSGGLNRVNWVLKTKPEIVILALGGNDALRGIPPEETKKNLSMIIEKLQSSKIKVLLAGIKAPQNMGEKFYKSFDNIYPTLAKKYKLPLIPFLLNGVALNPKLNIQDGIHPNYDGYKIVVEKNIWKQLKPLLKNP